MISPQINTHTHPNTESKKNPNGNFQLLTQTHYRVNSIKSNEKYLVKTPLMKYKQRYKKKYTNLLLTEDDPKMNSMFDVQQKKTN